MTPGDEIRGVASASPSPSTSSNTPSTSEPLAPQLVLALVGVAAGIVLVSRKG